VCNETIKKVAAATKEERKTLVYPEKQNDKKHTQIRKNVKLYQ
tara:strand:+ start:901 stop:1029 length:129 start_codon:yes stop_codon:yes gene_type:complete